MNKGHYLAFFKNIFLMGKFRSLQNEYRKRIPVGSELHTYVAQCKAFCECIHAGLLAKRLQTDTEGISPEFAQEMQARFVLWQKAPLSMKKLIREKFSSARIFQVTVRREVFRASRYWLVADSGLTLEILHNPVDKPLLDGLRLWSNEIIFSARDISEDSYPQARQRFWAEKVYLGKRPEDKRKPVHYDIELLGTDLTKANSEMGLPGTIAYTFFSPGLAPHTTQKISVNA